ncbi:MAG: trypsin-like peptidase domain-containing protein [Thermoleophilia bacterium]|nr:trypsin-like peptidase domain-containing protein [Thermoleophilia bacterium]
MSVRHPTPALLLIMAMALLASACGSGSGASDSTASGADKAGSGADAKVDSVLVLDGAVVASPKADTPTRSRARVRARDASPVDTTTEVWPELPLTAAGTIDDGPDPFEGEPIPVQAIPIEDDPYTTSTIAAAASKLRTVDPDQWDSWMGSNGHSPWQQDAGSNTGSLVKVTVERCGGARQVATGVVLDDETVVTTVHVVENAAKRVRVSSASGGARIPAMIRYLDVDDDVAVLRVPGLTQPPMPWHVPVGTDPLFAFAYGVSPVGLAGTMRRVPIVTSLQEESITVEQPDGFAKQITDRPVQTLVGGITTGFSGGVVQATNDTTLQGGWGFFGLIRARMGLRADTAGIVVPQRIVADALNAAEGLDEWFEIRPGGCPQWHR